MLTLEKVKKAALKAYNEGRLLTQNRDIEDYFYGRKVKGKWVCCAVGAALAKEQCIRLRNSSLDAEVLYSDVLNSMLLDCLDINPSDVAAITVIQKAHDKWLDGCVSESEFLALITEIPPSNGGL